MRYGKDIRNVSAACKAVFAFIAARSNRFCWPSATILRRTPLSMLTAMHFSISVISRKAETIDSIMRVRALVGRKTSSTITAAVPPIRKAIQRLRKFSVGVPDSKISRSEDQVDRTGGVEVNSPGTVSSREASETIHMLTIPTAPPFGYFVASCT